MGLKRIPLSQITANPDQPRKIFDAAALSDLAESIRENGLKQPITVRPIPETPEGHTHMVVMGERRFRAHQLLAEDGGVTSILCHVRKMDDETMDIDAILENLQRAEVSPLEEAQAYQRMIDTHGYTAETLAKKLGIKRVNRVHERIQLLGLTADSRDLVARGILYPRQAYYCSKLSPNGQREFIKLYAQGLCWTVKAAAEAAAAIQAREDQCGMDLDTPQVPKKRKPTASLEAFEAQIDAIAEAMAVALDAKGLPKFPEGDLDPEHAMRCLNKIRGIASTIRAMERAAQTKATVSAAA